jgi:anti-anti-sigma regulatory factor
MDVLRKQPTFRVVPDGTAMDRVTLSGDMDIYAAADVERAFESLSGREIVIDVRKVRTVASGFFSALIHLRWRLADSRIEVTGANEHVRRTFRAVGADVFVSLAPP